MGRRRHHSQAEFLRLMSSPGTKALRALRSIGEGAVEAYGAGDSTQGHRQFQKCVALCENFQHREKMSAWEMLIKFCANAGSAARESGLDQDAIYLFRQGIELSESFLAKGETHDSMRQLALASFRNGVSLGERLLAHDEIVVYYLALFNLGHGLPSLSKDLVANEHEMSAWSRSSKGLWIKICRQYREAHRTFSQLQPAWRPFLVRLLLRQSGLDLGHLIPAERQERLWLAEVLILLLQAECNARMPYSQDGPPLVGPVPLNRAARQLWRAWLDDPAPPSWSPENLARLRAQLTAQTWWAGLRAPLARWRGRRSLNRVEQALHLLGQPSPRSHRPSTRILAVWLASALAESEQLPKHLEQPGSILLGALYARYRLADLSLISDWRRAPPWANGGVALPKTWGPTGFEDWIGGRPRLALYGWLVRSPCPIDVDARVANSDAPAVAAPLESLIAGDPAPLAELLSVAWSDALRVAEQICDLIAGLGVVALESNNVRTSGALGSEEWLRANAQMGPDHHLHTPAMDQILDAVLLGRSPLATELTAYLERAVPAPPSGVDGLTAKRRFGRAIALHPGVRLHQELVVRIQSWGRQVIGDALREHDAANLWRVLETSRIALNGLHLKPPDEQSTAETAKVVLQTVITNLEVKRPGKVWPPLTVWRTSLEKDLKLHASGSLEACRTRLRKGEAIAQPFFDPASGRCRMLWLDSAQETLRLIDLPAECASAAWREPDGVLTAWESWVNQRGTQSRAARAARCMPTLWDRTRQAPAVRAIIAALDHEAQRTQVERIVLLLPSPLAQLPWEALAGSDWSTGLIERAATLSRWRRPVDSPSDEDAGPPWVLYDSDPKSVLLGQAHAESIAAKLGCEPWPSCAGLTVHDLMGVLSTGRGGHFVMHGDYRPDDPCRSGLYPSAGEFLPLWAACARPIPGGVYGLAACNAALSGSATADLLGPVGIAPALVAAGADRVIGPLWCVDSLAAWVFFDLDHTLAIAHPKLTAAARLPQTQAAMRAFPGERLKEMTRNALGKKRFDEVRTNHPLLDEPYPFNNPVHWAAFVVIGEG
jgi:hypothetical protein